MKHIIDMLIRGEDIINMVVFRITYYGFTDENATEPEIKVVINAGAFATSPPQYWLEKRCYLGLSLSGKVRSLILSKFIAQVFRLLLMVEVSCQCRTNIFTKMRPVGDSPAGSDC
ncbi:hypothetical protein ACT4UM_15735 [Bacillus sp. SS-TM]